jgi:hypothetical protein
MDDKERQEYTKNFIEYMKEKSSNQEVAQKFLVDVGVYTAKGNIRSTYKVVANSK